MRKLCIVLVVAKAAVALAQQPDEIARWERTAQNVTIVRDDWGIPHIHGKTDADAVFGLIYAQAEDDFNRVETNYLDALGRRAEAEGESAIFRDLRMKLFIHPDSMRAKYASSPPWLRALMDAWADGMNYYLYKNPQVTPRVITRFEPWMPLAFSEGSIGGDIERVSIPGLRAFYGGDDSSRANGSGGPLDDEPRGSNGFAIAPSNTANGKALLLINPHTSFFFREEAHVSSDEGLNAYGAITWGQFFVYQGFNATAGWMHTSSGVDNIDEYLETVTRRGRRHVYRIGRLERPVITQRIAIPFKTDTGMASREFTLYYTHRGPVVRAVDGRWVSVRLMQEPVKALTQSYTRTKATDLASFRKTMELYTNSSNNTIFADASGNIAYFHANFVPRRDTSFDWSRPVDGSDPRTEWKGLHTIDESPLVVNPASGWLYNTNNWPYSAAGANSPKRESFPSYMDRNLENARGVHAIRVLEGKKDFTLESLRDAAYDTYLTAFDDFLPALFKAWDGTPESNPLKNSLGAQIAALKGWDRRWAETSVPTSLAIFWATELQRNVARAASRAGVSAYEYVKTRATPGEHLQALAVASGRLAADFGSWRTPWGEINRFQRLTGDIVQKFDDGAPSTPVGFPSAQWGSLASFGARPYEGTKRWYGTSGNSFVAVVEFGKDSVRARAVTAGGLNSDPASPHFNDQAKRYATGDLREVYYYRSQLQGHVEEEYHPGARPNR
jgi:acyl-homoserine lactone acylase PvdQ